MNFFKKTISLFTVITLMISAFILPLSANALQLTTVPTGYTGIYTFEDLYSIRNNLHGKYILMNNIDMSEETKPGGDWDINGNGWLPIGDYSNEFCGIFDGNGYAISGMNIHGLIQEKYVGLFGNVFEGRIFDLKVENSNINIVNPDNSSYVGILAGYTSHSDIYSVYTSGNLYSDSSTDFWKTYVGGIIGYSDYYDTIENCYSIANISFTEVDDNTIFVGGIVGTLNSFLLKNCYFAGSVIPVNSNDIQCVTGAIFASTAYCGEEINSYYKIGSVSEQQSSTDCMGLTVGQMKSEAAFTGWDFENTWVIDLTGSYKYPQLRNAMQVPVTKIELIYEPDKLIYYQNEKIDTSGAYIEVTHIDNSIGQIAVSPDMIIDHNPLLLGTQNITIEYLGATTDFEIIIKPTTVNELICEDFTTNTTTISWQAIFGVNGYYIYKYLNNEWVNIAKTENTYFTDINLDDGSEYKYRVAAYISISDIDYIGISASVIAYTGLNAVETIKASPSYTNIKLQWSSVKGADGYALYLNHGGDWKLIGSTQSLSYTANNLISNTSYLFKVIAYSTSNDKVIGISPDKIIRSKTLKQITIKNFKLSTTNYSYTGSVKTPSVIVKDNNGKTLKKNIDYTVSYQKGRKNVGKYKVSVKMKGKYIGTKDLYFSIKPKSTKFTGSKATKSYTLLKWKKLSKQVTGFQIQYSTSSKFKNVKKLSIKSKLYDSWYFLDLKHKKITISELETLQWLAKAHIIQLGPKLIKLKPNKIY